MQKTSGMSVKENLENYLHKNLGVGVEWKEADPFWVEDEQAHKTSRISHSVHLCTCVGGGVCNLLGKRGLNFTGNIA